jgi:hypothetical protein
MFFNRSDLGWLITIVVVLVIIAGCVGLNEIR